MPPKRGSTRQCEEESTSSSGCIRYAHTCTAHWVSATSNHLRCRSMLLMVIFDINLVLPVSRGLSIKVRDSDMVKCLNIESMSSLFSLSQLHIQLQCSSLIAMKPAASCCSFISPVYARMGAPAISSSL